VITGPTGDAIEDDDGVLARCVANRSLGSIIIIEDTALAGGTPAIGDDINWNGAAEDGTVAYYDDELGLIGIIPDNVANDIIDTGVDDPTNGVWTTTNVVVTQTATAGGAIDCDTATGAGNSSEVDNEESFPAP
jgi:hypothetical protein